MKSHPVTRAYLEGGAALTTLRGPEAWLETGYRPFDNLAFFGRAYAHPRDAGVMAGFRWEF